MIKFKIKSSYRLLYKHTGYTRYRLFSSTAPNLNQQNPPENADVTQSTQTINNVAQQANVITEYKKPVDKERIKKFLDAMEKYKYVTSVILISCLTATGMLLYWLDERFFKHVGDKSSAVFLGVKRTVPKNLIKQREEETSIRDLIFEMDAGEILVVVGAHECGKSILLENTLSKDYDFRVCHIKMAQINDTKSFAEALRQALSASESVERFLLNTIFTKREELAKQHQMSNSDPVTKTLKEFSENVSNPSHMLNIDFLNGKNPNRQTVLFIDDFDALLPVLNTSEDKELRSKLIALFQIVGRAHGVKIVLCSSLGEVNKLMAAGKAESMTRYYFVNGLANLNQVHDTFQFLLSSRNKEVSEDQVHELIKAAYPIIGGDILMWRELSHNPSIDRLSGLQEKMNDAIKMIKARRMPKRGLYDEPKWTEDHVNLIFGELLSKSADGLPCHGLHNFTNIGVNAFDLEEKGVPWLALESLCYYNVLCYNPVSQRVTFSSKLMEQQALSRPDLWRK
ncbi:hypothetical protein AKO1_009254 [Acrasis kona]|uniref:ATPase domain-containing protein n=1 Tax=Acrasis kona TaxID=1008807 RepID=A0AAW2ZIW1_9EUKA